MSSFICSTKHITSIANHVAFKNHGELVKNMIMAFRILPQPIVELFGETDRKDFNTLINFDFMNIGRSKVVDQKVFELIFEILAKGNIVGVDSRYENMSFDVTKSLEEFFLPFGMEQLEKSRLKWKSEFNYMSEMAIYRLTFDLDYQCLSAESYGTSLVKMVCDYIKANLFTFTSDFDDLKSVYLSINSDLHHHSCSS